MKIVQNDPYNCSLCSTKSHKLRQIYYKCNCKDNNPSCNLKYCVRKCCENDDVPITLSTKGIHDETIDKEIATKISKK